MHQLHGGITDLSLAMLQRGDYLSVVMKTRGTRAMFETKDTQPVIVDVLQIEAEARRMRAEVFAAGVASLKAKIIAFFQNATSGKAEA